MSQTTASQHALYLLTVRDICEQYRISRSGVYQALKSGAFPSPLKVGRSTRWRATDVQAWADSLPQA